MGVGLQFSLWCLVGVEELLSKSFHFVRLPIPGPVIDLSIFASLRKLGASSGNRYR